ncbi:MAG: UDP-N-acetylenolpyruvoylglucosamine reductase [Desulfobacterales bacterium CG23_combo_of_CG06-09_8_20_14_all_52_9]|nr:MAG: UDP-N-acetylenolpyruvoylglucosamine reductase [Desulfobacterales bacterium CG23_combo_of_CG06-09_8_20_14_all_52_9]
MKGAALSGFAGMMMTEGSPEKIRCGREALGWPIRKWLTDHFGDRVAFDEPMSRHTSFRVGGSADAFLSLRGIRELTMIARFCKEKGIPYLVIGDGTNLLVTDAGIRGVVMTLTAGFREIKKIKDEGPEVTIQGMAGARARMLCRFAVREGFAGLNFAVGIPGTVGGALMMNAGTPRGCMADVVECVEIFHPEGRIEKYPRHDLHFTYRKMTWGLEPIADKENSIILSGFFRLRRSDARLLKTEADAILKERRERQPWRLPSAGCFFKNPTGDISAGNLIDRAGLKGKSIGGAQVSKRHANFIVNTGKATASDILVLAEEIEETVLKVFGVKLEPEVKIIGS